MKNGINSKRINLIPIEMAVPVRAVKIAKILNKLSLIVVIILILTSIIIGSIFFYYSTQNIKINRNISSSKDKITKLEKSEQKLVLAKDRLSKIEVIQKIKSVGDEVKRYQKFSSIVSASNGSIITEADLSSKGSEVSILSLNTDSLSQIITPISNLLDYNKIVLSSFEYNPSSGIVVNVRLEAKK